jgi:DNA-binding response OmpR family regulator
MVFSNQSGGPQVYLQGPESGVTPLTFMRDEAGRLLVPVDGITAAAGELVAGQTLVIEPARPPELEPPKVIKLGDEHVVINLDARTVHVDDVDIAPTAKEFSLLACLGRRAGQVVTNSELIRATSEKGDQISPGVYASGRISTRVHMSRVRRRLGPRFGDPVTGIIRTYRHAADFEGGYMARISLEDE